MRNNFLFGDKYDMNSLFASTARRLEELLKASWKRWALTTASGAGWGTFQGDDRLLYQSLL